MVFLCRGLEILERKVVYTPRRKYSVYYASRVSVYRKSFRVPKNRLWLVIRTHWARLPKVCVNHVRISSKAQIKIPQKHRIVCIYHYVFLWYFIMCFCGIMLRVFVVTNWMRLEDLEGKMIYTPPGSVVFTMFSAWVYF